MEIGTASRRRERIFYTTLAFVAAATVFAGFARTFYLRGFFGRPPLEPFLLFHGTVFTSWLALLIVQTTLIAGKRTAAHMKLGVAGGFLAALMILLGIATAIRATRRSAHEISDFAFLIIPLTDVLIFTILVACGFLWRRQPDFHKRFMLLATISILAPATARLPFAFIRNGGPTAYFGLADIFLAACIGYDLLTWRRVHRANIWGGLLVLLSQPARLAIGNTGAWILLASWLAR